MGAATTNSPSLLGRSMDMLKRRPAWKPSTIAIVGLVALIVANEAQRIEAQWQGHRERQLQLFSAQANTLKLDKVMAQNDLQIQLLTQHSTDLEKLEIAQREKEILQRPRR